MLAAPSVSEAETPASAVRPASGAKRILVIDDEVDMREFVGIALRERGYEVFEAGDGDEGLGIALKELPHLILCDVRMDRVTGYELLAKLREDPVTAAIPFVLMTGNDPDGAGIRQGMELGADDYLRKPFDFDSLYATVDVRLKKAELIRSDSEKQLAALRDNISLMLPHELRTPLNGILAYGDILRNEAETLPASEVAEMGQDIAESGRRLERLVENFLIYTQTELIGSDPHRMAALRGDPCPNAAAVVEECSRRQAENFGRPEDLDFELQNIAVPLSSEYLSKVVDELVQNAFKFSEKDTPVAVSLGAQEGHVHLVVSDMGRGMSSQEISHIGAFMQFGRKNMEQQGLGLGLTIARRLAGLYGGEVKVESEAGQGTRVAVRLPVA